MKDGGGYERDLDGELDIKIRDEREKNKSGTQISCSRKKKWVPLKQIKINKRGELGVNVINPFGDTLTSKSLWI